MLLAVVEHDVFSLRSICCRCLVSGRFTLKFTALYGPAFICLSPLLPALFHLPQHKGSCFLSLVLGSNLITYLFSLSYSKLLWPCVLLRKDIFLPPLLLAAFHPVSPAASHYPPPTPPFTQLMLHTFCYLV